MKRAALTILVLYALAGCALAAPRPASLAEPLPRDTAVVIGTLPNGLRYYVRANPEPEDRAELRLAVNAGSILEDPDQRGLAHFLEHMAFNGTERFARNELVDYLESVGMRFGPDINAYTSFDETVYMLTLPTDSADVLETGLEILDEWARGITLDPEEIERERGVVIEEWRLRQNAASRMQRDQFPVLMGRSRYSGRDPIGTRRSLETFDEEALRRFYRDWYRPDLMAVVAVGDFDPAAVEAMIHERFGDIPRPVEPRTRRDYDVPSHEETLVSIATDPEATASTVSLYLKRRPVEWVTTETFRRWLAESLANSMLTNRLSEITQRPGAPIIDVSSFHGRFIRPLSAHVLSARVPEGGVVEGLEALLTEAERAARHGFTATELEREKREMLRYAEQRYVERSKKTSSSFASEYVSHFLYGGTPISPTDEYELYVRLLDEVTLEDVDGAAAPWMRKGDRVVLIRAPEEEGVAIPSESALRAAVLDVEHRDLEPYLDARSELPLIGELPPPGRIVNETAVADAGVTVWELSNGARVLLKPTDHREEEILFAARSPGGLSLLEDDDYIAGLTATAVVQAGGLGELSSTELRKRLAGMFVGLGADIGETHEGLSGAAAPREIETLFKLVHLKFTAPRVDSSAFVAYGEQARTALSNRAAAPESAFEDTLRVVMAQHHPRVRPPTPAVFDSLDLWRSLEIYRDRFADASDFTFYLVGSFEPDSLRPLVERYLASLPALYRNEGWRDLGIRPPRGVVTRTVRRGMEEKGLTQLVFTGDMVVEPDSLQVLSVLGDVLGIRLREVLREELGGTYGVSVRAAGSRVPVPRYQVSIGFGSAPERIEELTGVIFDEIERLSTQGPTLHDVSKVQEMQIRAREVEVESNQFWIAQLLSFDQHGWPLGEILDGSARITAVTPEQVRAAAARYLDPENHVRVSLVPGDPRARRRD